MLITQNKSSTKENIALSCPLWLLYRGTANQSANQWKKRRSRRSFVWPPLVHCIFSVMLPLPRQPVQQPKTQSADCARFDIKHYAYIHYGKNGLRALSDLRLFWINFEFILRLFIRILFCVLCKTQISARTSIFLKGKAKVGKDGCLYVVRCVL